MKIDKVKIGENGLGEVYALKYTKEYKEKLYKYKLKQELMIIEYLRYLGMREEEILETLNSETLFSVYLSSIDQIFDTKKLNRSC